MFIEPNYPKDLFAPEERDIRFAGQYIALLWSWRIPSPDLSYKHLAALRPAHNLSLAHEEIKPFLMMFIDSHAHIDGSEYDADRDEVIQRARDAGVNAILTVGTATTPTFALWLRRELPA